MENEENKTPVNDENKPTTDETQADGQQGETEQNSDYAVQILALQTSFNKKLEEQKQAFEKRIADRDSVIEQLLTGANKQDEAPDDIVSQINSKRPDIKKW
mgnify:CR=1 FL=1